MINRSATFRLAVLAKGLLIGSIAFLLGAVAPGGAVMAQSGSFAAVVTINDRVVTRYELDQRILFMQLLRQPGDIEAIALKGLIEDRLRFDLADRLGLKIPPDSLLAGMEEFASRANLTAEQFIAALGQSGVEPQAFRDFVEAGLIWREIVRSRFGPGISITEAEIDRALAGFVPTTALKARYSEIILPATGSDRSNAMVLARRLKQEITKNGDFAGAARGNSAGPSAGRGGDVGWTRLSSLTPETAAVLRALAPGQVSEPVVLADSVVLYQMQELGEDQLSGEVGTVVEYAQFLFPAGDAGEAARIRAVVDTCNDLYAVGKGLPAERLIRESHPQADLPADIGPALALLDPGESSTSLTRGGWQVFLMLCRRGAPAELLPARDQVRAQLVNQMLASQAEIYMEELRSEAIIRQP